MRSSGPRAVCYEMSVAETLLEEIVCNRSWPICYFARQVKYRKTDSHLFYTIHAFSRCTTRECMLRHPQTSRPLRSEEKKRRKHKKYATAQSARKPRHSLRTLQPRHISYAVHNASSTHRLPTPLTRSPRQLPHAVRSLDLPAKYGAFLSNSSPARHNTMRGSTAASESTSWAA